jgi:hypothetical protein
MQGGHRAPPVAVMQRAMAGSARPTWNVDVPRKNL